ncbi:hypothetical protein TNCV_4747601 [Trichonephila clavipes]|nr:hypothetical protein TNCV_4747601 [Trichonephila clavipes]
MITEYNKKERASFHSRRESITQAKVRLLFPKQIHYSGFVPEPTRLQAEGHTGHPTGWVAAYEMIEKSFEEVSRVLLWSRTRCRRVMSWSLVATKTRRIEELMHVKSAEAPFVGVVW